MDLWPTETLSVPGLVVFFKAARKRMAVAERNTRDVNRLGFVVGAGGVVIGLLGMGIAWSIAHKMPPVQPPQYVLVDRSNGAIIWPVATKDAPRLYPEATRQAALRELIMACEQYVPQTWATIDWHACMIRLTPEAQKRRSEDIGPQGPRYPAKLFTAEGWAMPMDFPESGFVPKGQTGTAPNEVYHYQVRYKRLEVIQSMRREVHYSADVVFTFRPDLKINYEDALINKTGLQVVSLSFVKE